MTFFEDCIGLMDKNFARLRAAYADAQAPVMPYLGAFQRDLIYLEESPTRKGQLISMHKLKAVAAVIHNCLQFQHVPYWLKEVNCVARLITSSVTILSEDEQHARSLQLEPRATLAALDSNASGTKKFLIGPKRSSERTSFSAPTSPQLSPEGQRKPDDKTK